MKGFDIYKQLDDFCQETKAAHFTFIGRAPKNLNLTHHIDPLDVDGLIEELPKHNVYISASKHEAGANHVLEAIALGLPVLYHTDGGSINEYCKNSGISYTKFNDIVDIILNRTGELKSISSAINYTKSSEDAAKEYVKVLEGAI